MTWVVGGHHLFCARCMSDIQVTLEYKNGEKQYFDGVQKVHFIGPRIIIAFAGSIRLAFEIIDGLRKNFYANLNPRLYDRPSIIMEKMVKSIKYLYKTLKRQDKEHVEFLVFIPPMSHLDQIGMWKLVSPFFFPVEREKPFQMLELGSGSVAEDYREIVDRNSRGVYEVPGENGGKPNLVIPVGAVAMKYLFAEALEYKKAGISRAMHLTLIMHNKINMAEMPEAPLGVFPRVARSWSELKRDSRARGFSLAECHASA